MKIFIVLAAFLSVMTAAQGQSLQEGPGNKIDYARVTRVAPIYGMAPPGKSPPVMGYAYVAEYNRIVVHGQSKRPLKVGEMVRVRVVTSIVPAE